MLGKYVGDTNSDYIIMAKAKKSVVCPVQRKQGILYIHLIGQGKTVSN